jgi:hypothetical protein
MNIKKVSSALLAAYNAAAAFVKAYPGGIAGATTAVVALAATFGLHVTVNELASIVSAVAVVAGILVHLNTVPKPATPAAPTPPKMGVTAQSNFTSTAVPLTAPSNTSHDIAQSTNMGGSSSSSAGSSDQQNTSWSSGTGSSGSNSSWSVGSPGTGAQTSAPTSTGDGGNTGWQGGTGVAGATSAWASGGPNSSYQTSGQIGGASAHVHNMDHYHDTGHYHSVNHNHNMDHYHNDSHNHTMSHDHYYGAQQVTDFNELRDTVTSFFAMFSELSANLADYQNLVNRVNGVINHDNQGGATKLWGCLGA